MGQKELAAQTGRRAVASLERIRGNLNTGTLRSSYTADRVGVYADLVVTLLSLGRVDEAFRVADGAHGRGLIERLGAASHDLSQGASQRDLLASQQLLDRIDALVERLRDTDSARVRKPDRSVEAQTGAVAKELASARREYEAVIDRLGHDEPTSAVLGASTIGIDVVKQSLAPDEALLEFFSAPDRLVIFCVTRGRVQSVETPVGRAELAERVHLARELIARRDSAASVPLRDLYSKLIAPVERAGLLAGVQTLVIVPHAALTYLPFAALRTPDGHYLVERYASSVLASASALAALRQRPSTPATTTVASIAAPIPAELPGTRDEARLSGDDSRSRRLQLARSQPSASCAMHCSARASSTLRVTAR